MKIRKITILSTLALVIALFGCNKTKYEGGVAPGESTYVNFAIDLGGSGAAGVGARGGVSSGDVDENGVATRADENASDSEQKISRLRIYIFGGGVLESTGDIPLNAGNVGTSYLAAKTGPKLIYAVANPRPDMIMPLGATLESFKAKAVAATTADIAVADNFVMVGATNVVLQKYNEGAAMANPIPITVSRAAAKVQVKFNPATVQVNGSMAGKFVYVAYHVSQMNMAMYLPRTGTELTPKGQDMYQIDTNGDGTYDHLNPSGQGDGVNASVEWGAGPGYQAIYIAENVNENPCAGNTTFVHISAKYVPDPSEIKGDNTTLIGDTFYGVKNGALMDLYADRAQADAAAALLGVTTKVYEGGYSYYRINIRNTNKIGSKSEIYSVIRNNFYKINITEFKGFGGLTPSDPEVIFPVDPEQPLEVNTYLSATIIVEPWNPVVIDEPLG